MSRKRQEQRRERARQQRQREQELAKKKQPGVAGGQSAAAAMNAMSQQPPMSNLGFTLSPARPASRALEARPSGPPPTFSECVIGYREWIVDPVGQLRAITMTKQIWRPGVNVAECRPFDQGSQMMRMFMNPFGSPSALSAEPDHAAPSEGCGCGFYGWNDFRAPAGRVDDVDAAGQLYALGAIAAWGDLMVHRDGFRASHACVVALACTDSTSLRVRDVLKRVGDEYRVSVVHTDALQAEAERHGTPLPAHVRPRAAVTQIVWNNNRFIAPNTFGATGR